MNDEAGQRKVESFHLARNAYLYVRQSSLRQVLENTESTERQYALQQRARGFGWGTDQIIVIDRDQGQSGASAADREGFKELMTEVSLGRAGLVMGLEVSRLARNSSDWHRLLEICALSNTLILDEDGVYNPSHFNDRLLLGLKGTMSEAELYTLRARLQGGMSNKARRGELRLRLPVGFVYDAAERVVIDPDKQVRESLELLFGTFRRMGTATATARYFNDNGMSFPRRLHTGPSKGEVLWGKLSFGRVLEILRNPRYAGAYVWGRRRGCKSAYGRDVTKKLDREAWHTLLPDVHKGYITWSDFEENQKRLAANVKSGTGHNRFAPREGPALLQGLVLCGICGGGMSVRYTARSGKIAPYYNCEGRKRDLGGPPCQTIHGSRIDEAVSQIVLQSFNSVTIDIAIAVQEELQVRIHEADALRRKQVERAQYETDLARRRFMEVDPANRLVAAELEAAWNDRLRALRKAEDEYERRREQDRAMLDDKIRTQLETLVSDFPRLWTHPRTSDGDRKRMLRLVIEDAALTRSEKIVVNLRFKGGATSTVILEPPKNDWWENRKTDQEVIKLIDHLLDEHTHGETAQILNDRGYLAGEGGPFDARRIKYLCRAYGLRSRHIRLRELGLLTMAELTAELGVDRSTVTRWHHRGLIEAQRLDQAGRWMYQRPKKTLLRANMRRTDRRGAV